MKMLFRDIVKHLKTIDWFLVICVCAALFFGFIAVKSSTNIFVFRPDLGNQTRSLLAQTAAILLGISGAAVISKSDYMHILKYWKYLYIISLISLVAVRLFGTGADLGNTSWFRIGPVGIQPSEFVKIAFIITIANHLDKNKEHINSLKNIIFLGIYFLLPFGLILWAGDLGNGLIYSFVFLSMCFTAGVSLWYFLGGAFVLTALAPILWNWEVLMPEYRKMRIMRGFEPGVVDDWTYQVHRSMQAIGSGGLFGKGWQQGPITQGRSPRVPQQWTDFIFSAIGEEFGFIGAMITIIILTLIIVRILIISRSARNNTGSLICAGVMAMFIAQIIINIGMCLGMLPVIGVTLPFFSYGGSSVLSSLLCIGVVLSVNSRRNIYYFTRDENLDKY